MDTLIPLAHSKLAPIESAYLVAGRPNYGVGVGLGAATRLTGKCMHRHVSNGSCWGSYEGMDASRYVDERDHDISSITEENYVTGLRRGNIGQATNDLSQYASIQDPASQRNNGPWAPNGVNSSLEPPNIRLGFGSVYQQTNLADANSLRPCNSYGTYSNCPNCSLSGYGTYSRANCYGGDTVLGANGKFIQCSTRPRMRSIYDDRVQASTCG